MNDERQRLDTLLSATGIEPTIALRLARYGELLLEANRRFNLTGAATAEALAEHILDSLSLLPFVDGSLVDVGSGGGLPAIPLASATDAPVTLIEAVSKKAAFLESVLEQLGLTGNVIPERAELAAHRSVLRERFDTATARGVAAAPTVLELTVPFLRVGGVAALQRGLLDERERDAVCDAAPMLGARLEDEVRVNGERRVLLVRKTEPTPARFPRRVGIPAKRPLCY